MDKNISVLNAEFGFLKYIKMYKGGNYVMQCVNRCISLKLSVNPYDRCNVNLCKELIDVRDGILSCTLDRAEHVELLEILCCN